MHSVNVINSYFHLEVQHCFSGKLLLGDQESDATLGAAVLLAAVLDCISTIVVLCLFLRCVEALYDMFC